MQELNPKGKYLTRTRGRTSSEKENNEEIQDKDLIKITENIKVPEPETENEESIRIFGQSNFFP